MTYVIGSEMRKNNHFLLSYPTEKCLHDDSAGSMFFYLRPNKKKKKRKQISYARRCAGLGSLNELAKCINIEERTIRKACAIVWVKRSEKFITQPVTGIRL